MRFECDAGRLALHQGQTMRIRDGRGGTLCCEAGKVWITEEGAAGDVVLETGGCLRLQRAGLTVIEALRDAELSIH